MTTRVDFYLLDNATQQGRLKLACRVIGKAYDSGLKVLVQTSDERASKQLDDLLWTLVQGSFIPHAVTNTAGDFSHHPVLISNNPTPATQEIPHKCALVWLKNEATDNIESYQRVLDVVGFEEADKAAARQRFKHYRDQGHAPESHRLRM